MFRTILRGVWRVDPIRLVATVESSSSTGQDVANPNISILLGEVLVTESWMTHP